MKQHTKWFGAALTLAASLAMTGSLKADTWVLSDFQNFSLSATYANWDAAGSQIINGGTGYTPSLTPTASGFEVVAQGYGSGAYDFATPLNASGATQFRLTFTINTTVQDAWMGPNADISDGTHQVALTADNASGTLNYGPYSTGTYTLYGPLGDLDVTTITAFNLEFDPAGYGTSAPYDITYNSFVLTNVPEPATGALIALCAGLLLARRRFRLG